MSNNHDLGPPLNTFIVRFWQEPGASEGRWRGQVQHIQSGERAAFADKGTLMSFIGQWTDAGKTREAIVRKSSNDFSRSAPQATEVATTDDLFSRQLS